MKLIGLDNLPDNFRVSLEENFRRELFKKGIEKVGSVIKLGKFLGYSDEAIRCLAKGYAIQKNKKVRYFIKVDSLKKLSLITGVSLKDIENNIIGLKTLKRELKVKFPIRSSKELASLVGHTFGDGHVSRYVFNYSNPSEELIGEVKSNVKITFSTNIEPKEYKRGICYALYFPSGIARLLTLVGAPVGNKVVQPLKLPEWIVRGTKEIKVAFLKALYDDESHVDVPGKSINFHLTTEKKLIKELKEFLNFLRKIFSDLDIKCHKIRKFGSSKDGDHIELGFGISGFKNYKNFHEEINFTETSKSLDLKNMIQHLKKVQYAPGECQELIRKELKNSSMTTKNLAKKLNRTYECILYHLYQLYKENLVIKENTRPTLWKLK